jgi:hypothetical protein
MAGKVYVEYREWLAELADEVNSISDVADLDQIKGQLDPDNPLKWGVYKALGDGTYLALPAGADPEALLERLADPRLPAPAAAVTAF